MFWVYSLILGAKMQFCVVQTSSRSQTWQRVPMFETLCCNFVLSGQRLWEPIDRQLICCCTIPSFHGVCLNGLPLIGSKLQRCAEMGWGRVGENWQPTIHCRTHSPLVFQSRKRLTKARENEGEKLCRGICCQWKEPGEVDLWNELVAALAVLLTVAVVPHQVPHLRLKAWFSDEESQLHYPLRFSWRLSWRSRRQKNKCSNLDSWVVVMVERTGGPA